MCGRYTLRANLNLLLDEFAAEMADGLEWEPRFNIGPQPKEPRSPIVRLVDGKRQLTRVHWPFVPSFEESTKLKYNTVNARAETVATKPTYRASYKRKRCLVPADGWYEWEEVGTGRTLKKLPWFYEIDGGKVFAIAGLWDVWRDKHNPAAAPYESCTLIVTDGNDLTKRIGHDRMPVIIEPEDYAAWLACEEIPLVTVPAARISERRASTYVNKAGHEGPECLLPSDEK